MLLGAGRSRSPLPTARSPGPGQSIAGADGTRTRPARKASVPATEKILKQTGLSIDDIDLYEVNEAFGSVPLAWANAFGASLDKLNVNGGAQALGCLI